MASITDRTLKMHRFNVVLLRLGVGARLRFFGIFITSLQSSWNVHQRFVKVAIRLLISLIFTAHQLNIHRSINRREIIDLVIERAIVGNPLIESICRVGRPGTQRAQGQRSLLLLAVELALHDAELSDVDASGHGVFDADVHLLHALHPGVAVQQRPGPGQLLPAPASGRRVRRRCGRTVRSPDRSISRGTVRLFFFVFINSGYLPPKC